MTAECGSFQDSGQWNLIILSLLSQRGTNVNKLVLRLHDNSKSKAITLTAADRLGLVQYKKEKVEVTESESNVTVWSGDGLLTERNHRLTAYTALHRPHLLQHYTNFMILSIFTLSQMLPTISIFLQTRSDTVKNIHLQAIHQKLRCKIVFSLKEREKCGHCIGIIIFISKGNPFVLKIDLFFCSYLLHTIVWFIDLNGTASSLIFFVCHTQELFPLYCIPIFCICFPPYFTQESNMQKERPSQPKKVNWTVILH